MKNRYRWGILSTANIGRKAMIPALQASRLAEVVAVASRDEDRARQFAYEFAIPKAFGDYQALLDDPSIDAVYIPLPNHLHKPWAIKAAHAGKHILCEKPMGLNAKECEEMMAAAKENGVMLMESFMYRHHPRIQAAAEMVYAGKLGKIHTIESSFTITFADQDDFRYQPEMGGGALMDVGCYCINLSRTITGREPVVVQARAVWSETGVDEQLVGLLDFGQGLLAYFNSGFNLSTRQQAVIVGTNQYMVLKDVFLPGYRETWINIIKDGKIQAHSFEAVDEYRLIAEDFMLAIGKGQVSTPPADSVANLKVIEALLESAKDGGEAIRL